MWYEYLAAGIFLIIGYFFGSFSTGYIIGKKHGHNLQSEGSGNIGATNAMRIMGKALGILTFIGDLAKAFIPTLLVRFVYCRMLNYPEDLTYVVTLITGLGVFMGHIFPFYLKFRGGKGIAVSAAVIIATSADGGLGMWMIFIGIALFVLIVAVTGYVSVGSLVVMWYFPIYEILKFRDSVYFWEALGLGCIFLALIYIKHAGNIKRLIQGKENSIYKSRNKDRGL